MEILDQKYRCIKDGFFRSVYEGYFPNESQPLAKLVFHMWKRSVAITYKQMNYVMKYDSLLGSHFKLYHDGKETYSYYPSFASGTIQTDTDDPLLITLGIYAHIKRRNNA